MISTDINWITRNPYYAYTYSYPHKSAYRHFDKPKRIRQLWEKEDRQNLFLYLHIPFCEMRCGFCNLFTTVNPKDSMVQKYLDALKRQADILHDELGPASFSRLAIGGGTPTFLTADELRITFEMLDRVYGVSPQSIPTSIETSPQTATPERLSYLQALGIERISIGVQSFLETEAKAIGRPQKNSQVETSLDNIRQHPFPKLNIDLIYGAAEQTPESWLQSIKRALNWSPEEIYLYPLYVRPQTGLDGRLGTWDDHRLQLYRTGRDFLLEQGYKQISMRMFSKKHDGATTEYCCQEDGMLGLGAGARSYTRNVHYSTDYAVQRAPILSILDEFNAESIENFAYAQNGVELDEEEIIRRDIIKSILRIDGLNLQRFHQSYKAVPTDILPQLTQLLEAAYLEETNGSIIPTSKGLEYADAIGPWLFSAKMKAIMYQEGVENAAI